MILYTKWNFTGGGRMSLDAGELGVWFGYRGKRESQVNKLKDGIDGNALLDVEMLDD